MTNARATPRLVRYFDDYSGYHLSGWNKICHYVGIPLLMIAIPGLLARIQFGPEYFDGILRFDLGLLLWLASAAAYVVLDWKIGIPFVVVGLACYALGRWLPISVLWALFVVGWIFQFVGHYVYEKKSPAFMQNFMHLLIGPLWVFANWVGYYRGESKKSER